MLTGKMIEEPANVITCVKGNARQRRTIYEADQNFDRFGKPYRRPAAYHDRCRPRSLVSPVASR